MRLRKKIRVAIKYWKYTNIHQSQSYAQYGYMQKYWNWGQFFTNLLWNGLLLRDVFDFSLLTINLNHQWTKWLRAVITTGGCSFPSSSKVAGVLLLLYASLCVVWIWPSLGESFEQVCPTRANASWSVLNSCWEVCYCTPKVSIVIRTSDWMLCLFSSLLKHFI